jgi:hypothetical protein
MNRKFTLLRLTLLWLLLPSVQVFAQTPEVLYYNFNGSGTTVPNLASSPPTGTATATLMGGLTQGSTGKCGGALIGSGISSTSDYLNTGWAPNIGTGSWSISFWTSNFTSSTTLYYIFGDLGTASFRCFTNGVAGPNNWILRGAGLTDVYINGGATVTPHLCTYVYDNTLNNVKGYLDGNLVTTVAQVAPNITGTGPFKVMGYSSNIGAPLNGLIDEFRFYSHALTQAEINALINPLGATATASSSSVCPGSTVTLTAGGGNGIYTWTGSTITPVDGVPFVPAATDTYTVTTSNAQGCTVTATVTVLVNPAPSITATATPNTVCAGGTVTLTGGGGVSYSWNDGVISPIDNTLFIPQNSSVFTVTATDASGCTGTNTVAVTVNSLPTVTANASPSTTIPNGSQLTLSGGGANTYVWSGPVPVTDNSPFTATLAASGTYMVVGTDANTCTASATIAISVINILSGPNAYLYGASPFQDSLWAIDTNTWTIAQHISPSLASFTIDGINGMAFDPCTFQTYVILKLTSSSSDRALATIDLATGVCTLVGMLGDRFSSITFREDGQLFGVTGDGATVPETMYLIDKSNATKTLALTLGSGSDGEILSYNYDDDFIYHWSGGSTGVVMEKIASTSPYNITSIPISGSTGGETFGSIYLGQGMFINSNINSSLFRCTSIGVYDGITLINTPDDLRGLVQPPKFSTNTDSLCAKVDTIKVSSAAAQQFQVFYHWGDGTVDSAQGNVDVFHTYATAGTKTITVLMTAGVCSPDTFWQKVIEVKNTPLVTLTGPNVICGNGSITLNGSSGGSSQWYQDGNILNGETNNTLNVTVPGSYNMIKTNLNGCADSAASPKVVTTAPLPTITASLTPNITCANTSVLPEGSGGTSYIWSGGLTNNVSFIASASTNYLVTGTDANGCTNTATVGLIVNSPTTSLAGTTSNQQQQHLDDFNLNYYNTNCDLIATVDDGLGGNFLGLTTAIVNVDGTAGFHNGQPFVRRWYQITPTNNGGANVTLFIDQSDFNDYNAVVLPPYLPMPSSGNNADPNIGNIRITKNDDAGLGSNPLVITPAVNWNGNYWELNFNTTSFSQFRVHSANNVNAALPVSISSFDGHREGDRNELHWITSQEQNNSHFTIWYSTNGTDYSVLGKVQSNAVDGASQQPLVYHFTDTKAWYGNNYYRLEQVDLDGRRTFFNKTINLAWESKTEEVKLYPNPVNDQLQLSLFSKMAQPVNCRILDMYGRILNQWDLQLVEGNNFSTWNCERLTSGIYTLELRFNTFASKAIPFVKE